MLIATWNVNSIRTRLEQVKSWLDKTKPDLLCLQETKVDDELFPYKEFENKGYYVNFYGQKAYNGVALISKEPLEDVRKGFKGEIKESSFSEELDVQKRLISGLIKGIRIVNVYVPNGSGLDSPKYSYKLHWIECLKEYLNTIRKREEPICLLGDFNIALEDKDIHNPEKLSGGLMASIRERKALRAAINGELDDVFRVFENESDFWSWWDYRSGAWERDKGWRIDHIYLSNELIKQAKSCLIDKKVRGNIQPSDHAPVLVELNWPANEEWDNDLDLFQ